MKSVNQDNAQQDDGSLPADDGPSTIAEVMEWARQRVADIAGVSPQAVKLELMMEY